MTKYQIRFHPDFFKDLDKLSKKDLEIFEKKRKKIVENPLRQKHLAGGENCYRESITGNIRLIYSMKESMIWFLIIDKHDKAYEEYRKRIYSLKEKYGLI